MTTLDPGQGGSTDRDAGPDAVRGSAEAAMTVADLPHPRLDYYLIRPRRLKGESSTRPAGIVVEEFVLAEDFSAVRLDSTGWNPEDRHWRNSAAVSREMRADANLRSHVVAISRREVESIFHRLGGGELPDEETLGSYLHDGEPLPTSAPLRLSPGRVTVGFHDTRVYRILLANELRGDGLANLAAAWRMTITGDLVDPHARVLGTAHLRLGGDVFTWELRRIGAGVGWCLDLTANLATTRDDILGPLLRNLTTELRGQGLLPVTIERFC